MEFLILDIEGHSNMYLFLDDGSNSPKAPPRSRRDRSNRRSSPTSMMSSSAISSSSTLSSEPVKPQPMSNGLPPTPKVHMGACFSKVKTAKIWAYITNFDCWMISFFTRTFFEAFIYNKILVLIDT